MCVIARTAQVWGQPEFREKLLFDWAFSFSATFTLKILNPVLIKMMVEREMPDEASSMQLIEKA